MEPDHLVEYWWHQEVIERRLYVRGDAPLKATGDC